MKPGDRQRPTPPISSTSGARVASSSRIWWRWPHTTGSRISAAIEARQKPSVQGGMSATTHLAAM